MSISNYRNFAADVIYSVYQALTTFRGQNGEKVFFDMIFENLMY